MSFLAEYFGVIESTADQAVCCPFDHQTPQGLVYKESHASAHINTEKKVFHCKACDRGYSEQQFIQEILGCDYIEALKLARCFDNNEDHIMEASTNLSDVSNNVLITRAY